MLGCHTGALCTPRAIPLPLPTSFQQWERADTKPWAPEARGSGLARSHSAIRFLYHFEGESKRLSRMRTEGELDIRQDMDETKSGKPKMQKDCTMRDWAGLVEKAPRKSSGRQGWVSPGWKEGEGRQSAVKGAHTGLREMRHKVKTTQGSSGGFTPGAPEHTGEEGGRQEWWGGTGTRDEDRREEQVW